MFIRDLLDSMPKTYLKILCIAPYHRVFLVKGAGIGENKFNIIVEAFNIFIFFPVYFFL